MKVEWSEDYAIGMEKVDNQHKGLFDFMEKLPVAAGEEVDRKEMLNNLDYLKRYAMVHFDDEENIMEKNGYPLIDEHMQLHIDFIAAYANLVKDYGKNGATVDLADKIVNMVGSWLVNHIAKSDRDYAEYIKNN